MTDELHPRPRLTRTGHVDLCGEWQFAHDDGDEGLDAGWMRQAEPFTRTILVPFPPEAPASGIGDPAFHPVVWYRREVRHPLTQGRRLLLHFGAVDYEADVWVNGSHVAHHRGGHTPFSADITNAIGGDGAMTIVVRAHDDPADLGQPRGKQDWQETPHGIWYNRTTGIWQPVWLEEVPQSYVETLHFSADLANARVDAEIAIAGRRLADGACRITLMHGSERLACVTVALGGARARIAIPVEALTQEQKRRALLWSPDNPVLVDVRCELIGADGQGIDVCDSYLGLRTVGVGRRFFLLNDAPIFVRSVLSQGYWPQSHLAAPDEDAIRREVELIKAMGFNAVRIHQKAEDPRFLYWCDRLGVLAWGEMANAYRFSAHDAARFTEEWLEAVERDRSNPSIVTWVPLNESWGIGDVAQRPDQAAFAEGLFHLTKAIDPTRPVIANDGWEFVAGDIDGIHDYSVDAGDLRSRYASEDALGAMEPGFGPQRRRGHLKAADCAERPRMITEFGGIGYKPAAGERWSGYATVTSAEDYLAALTALFDALHASPSIAGYCYTQLTDTMQETNGLLTEDRMPKLDIDALREVITRPSAALPAEKLDRARAAATQPGE